MFSYATLSGNYSVASPKGFRNFMKKHGIGVPNTCAVRLAYALFRSEKSFFRDVRARSGVEWYGLPTKAADLAIILNKKIKRGQLVRSQNAIMGKTGIIFFDTIIGFDGTGHISLWDGKEVSDAGDYFDDSPRVYFWNIP